MAAMVSLSAAAAASCGGARASAFVLFSHPSAAANFCSGPGIRLGEQRGRAGCVCAPRGVAFAGAEGEAVLARLRPPLAPASLATAAMCQEKLL